MDPKIEYKYNDFSILLPSDHMLPFYQKAHKKYDKFLPHLIKNIDDQSTIIDVGANCGDTLAGMVDVKKDMTFVCIEPDDVFYDYLEKNVSRILANNNKTIIYKVKSLVGKTISNASLEGIGGTKHAVPDSVAGNYFSEKLDSILSDITCTEIKLLKTDVDGFDYDVIDSAESLLLKQKPIIYFECAFDHEYQKNGYINTIKWLTSIGYKDYIVFDNFGELMIRTKDIYQIFQLIEYIWKQNKKGATRTIFYYDILTVCEKDKEIIDMSVCTY